MLLTIHPASLSVDEMYSYICGCEPFTKNNETIDDQYSIESVRYENLLYLRDRFLTPREDIMVEQLKQGDRSIITARYIPSNQSETNQLQSILFSPFQLLLWPS